jgi:prepilin-type N-terminal cleavage/methylation domain-containing protein
MSRPSRSGFTIAELLVSLVVTSIGLLALAGADTLAWKRRMRADHRVHATLLARARIERLASLSCSSAVSGGAASDGNITERWSVVGQPAGPQLIEATVSWPSRSRAGRDSIQLAGSRWCE